MEIYIARMEIIINEVKARKHNIIKIIGNEILSQFDGDKYWEVVNL